MTERHLPSRVMLLHGNGHCKDVNSITCAKLETGLLSTDKSRWCFCGAACDAGQLQIQAINRSHCHLFQQLPAHDVDIHQKYYQRIANIDDKSNGKTRCSLRHGCLLLDGTGAGRDAVQLTSVTCSYKIPSSIECLDLAASGLQRISGSYCISRQLPCVMSLCSCRTSTNNAAEKPAAEKQMAGSGHAGGSSGRKKNRKPRKCDLSAVRQVEVVSSTREKLRDRNSSIVSRRQQVCRPTRSASKQQMNSCHLSAVDTSVAGLSTGALSPSNHLLQSLVNNTDMSPAQTYDNSTQSQNQTTAASSAERKMRLTSLAAETDNSRSGDADRVTKVSRKTARADSRRSLIKYRRLRQKVIRARDSKLSNQTRRKLRSYTSSLADRINSGQVITGDQPPGHRHTAITANCEVLVPRLPANNSSHARQPSRVRHPRKQQRVPIVPQVSVSDAADYRQMSPAAESTVKSSHSVSYMSPSQNVNSVSSERETNGDVSKSQLSALSVNVSFDCDDMCNSPASPLPVPPGMKRADTNIILQSASRRSEASSYISANGDDDSMRNDNNHYSMAKSPSASC